MISYRDSRRSYTGLFSWRTLALRLLFLTIGDLEITLLVVLTSLGEAILVAPLPGANLAPEDFGSEVMVTSPLARSGALLFALLRRYLALQSAPVSALRLITLIVPLGTGAALAMLSAPRDTPLTLLRGADLALETSALWLGEASGNSRHHGSNSALRLA